MLQSRQIYYVFPPLFAVPNRSDTVSEQNEILVNGNDRLAAEPLFKPFPEREMAEGVGFEPTVRFLPRSISSRVP